MISKLLKEGEAAPFGYGFVRHRFDYLGVEVAPLPLNYLIRWIYERQSKSYVPATKKELNAIEAVRELQIQANGNGYERGLKDGRDWTIRTYEGIIANRSPVRSTPSKSKNIKAKE
jgi:hypothetical protein